MMAKLVTLVTEGATNHVVLPSGQKLNLGAVSPLKVVCAFYTNKREAKRLLDRLLAKGSVVLRVDLDVLGALFKVERRETYPYRKLRWAHAEFEEDASPLMKPVNCGGSVMLDNVERVIRKIEARASYLDKCAAEGEEVTGADVQGVKDLVEELKAEAPKGQSKNDYFSAGKGKEAAVEEQLNSAIDHIASTRKIVDRLEASGRKFNASRARADLLDVADKLRTLLASESISEEKAQAVVGRVDQIHKLFAGAR